MVVPDFELICEIMLVAEGFQEARLLARKFITLYQLCKDLLSKQGHYDWGLRAIKSVLVVAGSLKRGDRKRPEEQVSSTHSTGMLGGWRGGGLCVHCELHGSSVHRELVMCVYTQFVTNTYLVLYVHVPQHVSLFSCAPSASGVDEGSPRLQPAKDCV